MNMKDILEQLFDNVHSYKNVLFRVDAGRVKGLSYGHLIRCHILAQALREYFNIHSTFLMQPIPDGIEYAKSLGEEIVLLEKGLPREIYEKYDAIVFDLVYGPNNNKLLELKKQGCWTIVLDDYGNKILWANVILNSSVLAVNDSYPSDAKLLLGPDYFILPKSFEGTRCCTKAEKKGPLAVIMTFGASDPTNLTINVTKALLERELYYNVNYKIIMGPGFTMSDQIESMARNINNIDILNNPSELMPIFCDADLVVCAGGRTLYEVNSLKIPTIAIASIDHEVPVVRAFREHGLIIDGLESWDSATFLKTLEQAIVQLH